MNDVTPIIVIAFVSTVSAVGAVYVIIRTVSRKETKEKIEILHEIQKSLGKLDLLLGELKKRNER